MLFGKEIYILNELEKNGKKVDDDEETTDYTVDNEDDNTDDDTDDIIEDNENIEITTENIKQYDIVEELKNRKITTIVLDEAHKIKNPKTAPIAKDKTISITGLASISYRFITPFPVSIVLAILNKTENKIKATASSRATTGSKVSVTGPLALYCLITSNVAAGAVAQLIAARVRIRGHDI